MTDKPGVRIGRTAVCISLTLLLLAAVLFVAAGNAPWEVAVGNLMLRSQRGVTHDFPTPPGSNLVSVSRPVDRGLDEELPPRNLVLVIGDGMGVGQVSSASALLHGPDGGLTLERAPIIGLMSTYAGNLLVTDSAASATAMATGFKAPKKAIATLADGREAVTLFEAARSQGLSTGLMTTSGLVDATPAGFTAHAEKREHYPDILEDMLASGSEVLIGGDWSDYKKALKNHEFQHMLAGIDEIAGSVGYEVVRDHGALEATAGPVLALFPPRGKGGDAHGPPLDELVPFVLDRLADNETGFVLLVESEVTDGEGHANDVVRVVEAVHELDRTVEALLTWAEPRGDTLIVVTADHDTGGLGVVDGYYSDGAAEVRWATVGHTAQWVPVFAWGPGATHFNGVIDNTDIAYLAAKLLKLEDFPRVRP